jgi:hypothetical protein
MDDMTTPGKTRLARQQTTLWTHTPFGAHANDLFLNRGIVYFHKKPVYGAKNAAAIMVSSSMLIRPGGNGTLYPVTPQ